ncbi:transposase, putative [Trichonephila clavata]|uniref:Transposase, putative n=1 Tax=Trichonephila clavata TaxID=2740835 RepID=A0A8X6KR63_TRICU|nr:transposase, putative [Trichonephila clavata]
MIKCEKKIPSREELWLHGCAKTTETTRRAIQNSKESIAKLSKYYNLNPKTIVKWKKRLFARDADMGPKHARSTVLTLEEEAVIVAFQVRTEEGKLYLFVAIDRTSKFTYVELHNTATKPIAAEFLRNLIKTLPYKIHTILTDNGIQFTNQKRHKYAFKHIFDRVCTDNGIEHRLTKVSHPWTNGQVERMNKTLKNATVKKSVSPATQRASL